jgi:hypothetical protein
LRDDLLMVQLEIVIQRRKVLTADVVVVIVDEFRRTREQVNAAELRSIVAALVQCVTTTGWRLEARPRFRPSQRARNGV